VKKGFTLIELMIVVAIVGILAAVAVPKFADLIRKSDDARTQGNLGALRVSISIYYGENEGWFPAPSASGDDTVAGSLGEILTMQNGKYIKDIPDVQCSPYHPRGFGVTVSVSSTNEASFPGEWGYKNVEDGIGRKLGDIWVNCTHTDIKQNAWGSY
jgi:prepilin-type N-terminal cleavage/methylation domain-containing protein